MWVQTDNERDVDSTGEYYVERNTDTGERRRGKAVNLAGR